MVITQRLKEEFKTVKINWPAVKTMAYPNHTHTFLPFRVFLHCMSTD